MIKACHDNGVYFHDYGGGPIHHGYSLQHSEKEIDEVLNVVEKACRAITP